MKDLEATEVVEYRIPLCPSQLFWGISRNAAPKEID